MVPASTQHLALVVGRPIHDQLAAITSPDQIRGNFANSQQNCPNFGELTKSFSYHFYTWKEYTVSTVSVRDFEMVDKYTTPYACNTLHQIPSNSFLLCLTPSYSVLLHLQAITTAYCRDDCQGSETMAPDAVSRINQSV